MKGLSLILSLLLGLVTSPVYAVQKIATIDVPDHPPPPFPTQLRKVVVLIQAVCKTDDKRLVVESGTGFIVGYSPSTAAGKSFDYLVTNRHVAECWENQTLRPQSIQSISVKMNLNNGTSKEQETTGNLHWYSTAPNPPAPLNST